GGSVCDQQRLRARAPDPGPARAARLAGAGGGGRLGIPRRLDPGGTGRLLQWHQPRVADQWRGPGMERGERGQLPECGQRAGRQPRRPARHRCLRGDPGPRRATGCTRQCSGAAHAGSLGMNAPGPAASDPLLSLVREDLRGFGGYASARTCDVRGEVWLNANESPWANPADTAGSSRRYPDPQPPGLREALARVYGCSQEQLLIGRGSDEAIDLLVRVLCTPGRDAVVSTPPVFGMYAVSARLQNAPLLEVPLVDGPAGFSADLEAVAAAAERGAAKLVFLCSPSNPTGASVPLDGIAALAARLEGRALVVVDEAYGEFSAQPSAISLIKAHRNLAVLRTLSKAHALAAARIGVLVADPALVRVLRACQAPYPVPTPCAQLATAGLS